MSRHVYFGEDGNVAFLCIADDLFDIFLGIIAAVGGIFSGLRRGKGSPAAYPLYAHGAFLCKLGKTFYFDPPAIIVGEVPVKGVVLVLYHFVYVAFHFVFGKEMAANVEH